MPLNGIEAGAKMDPHIIMTNKLEKWIKDNKSIVDRIIYNQIKIKEIAINDNLRHLWTCCYFEIKQIAEKDGIDFTQIPEDIKKGAM